MSDSLFDIVVLTIVLTAFIIVAIMIYKSNKKYNSKY